VMRSKTLTADQSAWEFLGDLFNQSDPQKGSSLYIDPNHASPAIMLYDSTSWVLHPVYMKDEWRGQGRQGLLNQVRYNATNKPLADYPVNLPLTAPKLPSSGIPWMVPKSDFFNAETLNPEWSYLGYTALNKSSLTDRPGWLRLSPKSSSKANTVIKNDAEHNYSLITKVDFKAKSTNDEAGLRIMRGDDKMYVKLCSSVNVEGKKVISFSFNGTSYEAENVVGDTLWLKIIRINHIVSGYYSSNGFEWSQVGKEFIISVIDSYTDNTFTVWESTRQGLYVQGTSGAFFDLYIYRDAYSPILAECPANQYGTTRSSISQGIRVLKSIHPTDWALYAGVEFGNKEYSNIPDSVEFTASCATLGGTIEVWLDSIDTGSKVAECTINNTGGTTKFKTFQTTVLPVSGNHDVYFKFNGTGTDELFQLKWINFIRKPNQPNSSQLIEKHKKVSIYPNPVKSELSIQTEFLFDTIEILTMNGRIVRHENYKLATNKATLSINLEKGIYFVKVSNGNINESSRMVVE
jgi:xylan 1,4-beta-xylosidase